MQNDSKGPPDGLQTPARPTALPGATPHPVPNTPTSTPAVQMPPHLATLYPPHYVHHYGYPYSHAQLYGNHSIVYNQPQQHPNVVNSPPASVATDVPVHGEGRRVSPRKNKYQESMAEPGSPSTRKQRAKGGQTRGKGRGARSGGNVRTGGASDTEISRLSEKEKKAAEIVVPKGRMRWTDETTMKVVQYLTAPERWEKISLNLAQYCTKVRIDSDI